MMKLRLTTVIVATSLSLSACNAGSNNSNASTANVRTQGISTTLQGKSSVAGEKPSSFINYAASGLVDGFLSDGLFAIPGGFAVDFLTNALSGWIFGEKEDPYAKRLEQMDKKLDMILNNLQTSLALSADTLNIIGQFYKNAMMSELQSSLGGMDSDVNSVASKFNPYIIQNVFGDADSDHLEQLYAMVKTECNDPQVSDALDARSGKLKGPIAEGSKVDQMFNAFTVTYASQNYSGGSLYAQLEANKNNYLMAVFSKVQKNEDLMNYINYYNYQNIVYASKLLGAYQNLYTMQVAQLAYHYACNADISFSNIKLPQGNGYDGFNQAMVKLNAAYNDKSTQLNKNIAKYLSPLDNKELFSWINGSYFTADSPLLSASSFDTNQGGVGNCSLTKINFKTTPPHSSGIIDMEAKCVTSGSEKTGFESEVFTQEIPYVVTAARVDKAGLKDIAYDASNSSMKSTFNGNALSKNDIGNIAAANYASDLFDLSDVTLMSYSEYKNDWIGDNWYAWTAARVVAESSDVNFYKANFIDGGYDKMSDDQAWVMPSSNTVKVDEENINFAGFYKNKVYAIYSTYGYADWFLGNYAGKAFAIEVDNLHYNETKYDTGSHDPNLAMKRVIGLVCLTENCKKIDSNTLRWNDGTEVKLTNISSDSLFSEADSLTLRKRVYTWKVSGSLSSPKPKGNYTGSCYNIIWHHGILSAVCQTSHRTVDKRLTYRSSELGFYHQCKTDAEVENRDGILVCKNN